MSTAAWKPTQAELLAASARTAAVLADPSAARADVARAVELEEKLYAQIEAGPCDRLTDPGPARSRIDWTPEIDREAAEAEAELEAAF